MLWKFLQEQLCDQVLGFDVDGQLDIVFLGRVDALWAMEVRPQQFTGGAGGLFGSFTIVRHEAKLIEAQHGAAKFFCLRGRRIPAIRDEQAERFRQVNESRKKNREEKINSPRGLKFACGSEEGGVVQVAKR